MRAPAGDTGKNNLRDLFDSGFAQIVQHKYARMRVHTGYVRVFCVLQWGGGVENTPKNAHGHYLHCVRSPQRCESAGTGECLDTCAKTHIHTHSEYEFIAQSACVQWNSICTEPTNLLERVFGWLTGA